jgi:hypothetical protein
MHQEQLLHLPSFQFWLLTKTEKGGAKVHRCKFFGLLEGDGLLTCDWACLFCSQKSSQELREVLNNVLANIDSRQVCELKHVAGIFAFG